MNKTYFPKKRGDAWTLFSTCPKCNKEWFIRHFKIEGSDKMLSEFMYVHYRMERSNLKKVYFRIFRCLKCFSEFPTELPYVDEQRVTDDTIQLDTQAYNEYLKLKDISLGKEVKEEELGDDNLDKLISELQKGAKI